MLTARTGRLIPEPPRSKPRLEDCYFYHFYDLNDGSTVSGPGAAFDLRGCFDEYIGRYDIANKTVFDFGTASGFLAFSAEKAGAEVTAFDTRSFYYQDRVPFENDLFHIDKLLWAETLDSGFRQLHNSFWYMWHEFQSSAKIVYGSMEDLVLTTDKFDVVLAGAVLEHIGDPISALGVCARLAKEAVILGFTPIFFEDDEYLKPLIPWDKQENSFVWWGISKGLCDRVFHNLGFELEYVPVAFDLVDDEHRTTIPRHTVIARRMQPGHCQSVHTTVSANRVSADGFSYSDDCSTQVTALEILRMLRPHAVNGLSKVRLGKDNDGGYIMVDDLCGITAAYSLGISNDVSWDLAIANRGIPVYQFDHTIDALPEQHPSFSWQRIGIGDSSSDGKLRPLAVLMAENGHTPTSDLILKCDIEGAEWRMLSTIPREFLRCFRQIVIEIHGLGGITDPRYAIEIAEGTKALTSSHRVVHVHANNNSAYCIVGGVPIPTTLELTLVRMESYELSPSSETFPTPLDQPCYPHRADFYLGQFIF